MSKYSVDVKGFDEFLDSVPFHDGSRKLIIIDEIGKMELFSDKSKKTVKELLDGDKPVMATIAIKGGVLSPT